MPLSARRPILLQLTLPRPPLECSPMQPPPASSSSSNPRTPLNQRTDPNMLSVHRSSVDSWCSADSALTTGSAMSSIEYEWTPAQIQILCNTLENLPEHLFTPYVGTVPPQNILQKLARGVKDARNVAGDWPHSIRATRQMLHNLAQKLAQPLPTTADAPHHQRQQQPIVRDATNTPPKRQRQPAVPLYRKNSMDDLLPGDPPRDIHSAKENINITTASTRLQQRADRFFTFHPHAHSRQRDSMISAISDPTGNNDAASPVVSSLSPQDAYAPALSGHRRSIRRTTSTSSQLATVNEGKVPTPTTTLCSSTHPLAEITHRTSNPCMALASSSRTTRVRRSDSFVRPLSLPGEPPEVNTTVITTTSGVSVKATLKRAPSYGAVAQQKKEEKESGMEVEKPLPPVPTTSVRAPSPASCSSDEEEKKRSKSIKRMKTMHRKPSYLGAELPSQAPPAPRLPSSRDQYQTVTVEEFTVSMESLPSLSSSSSTTALSMRSVATMRSSKSRERERKESTSSASSSSKRKKTKEAEPVPPVPPLPSSVVSPPAATPSDRASSQSPPRTLRRVGKNRSLKLEPLLTSGLVSPPREIKPTPKKKGLSELGRTLSFGGPSAAPAPPSSSREGLLRAAGLSLSSPFEEKPNAAAAPVKEKRSKKYLF